MNLVKIAWDISINKNRLMLVKKSQRIKSMIVCLEEHSSRFFYVVEKERCQSKKKSVT